jgi:hypothetical protein
MFIFSSTINDDFLALTMALSAIYFNPLLSVEVILAAIIEALADDRFINSPLPTL